MQSEVCAPGACAAGQVGDVFFVFYKILHLSSALLWLLILAGRGQHLQAQAALMYVAPAQPACMLTLLEWSLAWNTLQGGQHV